MNNVFLLIKNYYKMFFSKLLKRHEIKILPMVGLLIISLLFVLMFAGISYNTIQMAKQIDEPEMALSSFSITILMFVLMLIITESSPIRKNTDDELLLALPFKKRQIVTAKVLYFLSFDVIVIALLIMPSYILYNILIDGSSKMISLRACYVIILGVFLANGISGLISVFFAKITQNFRHSEIIKSIFSVFLIISFALFYLLFVFISQDLTKVNVIYDIYLVKVITTAIAKGKFTYLIFLTMISIVLFIISIVLKSHYLGKNINHYHAKTTKLTFKKQKPLYSLYKKEINKYFSLPIYVTNTIFGPLFAIVLGIVIAVIGKNYFIELLKTVLSVGYVDGNVPNNVMEVINSYFNFGTIAIIALLISVAPTTASSISLEGKQLWILQAHPIKYRDVLIAKLLLNITIMEIPIIIASILISTSIGLRYLPFILIILTLVVVISSIIGLYVNLLYPKIVWESEQEVIKQSVAVLVSMLLNVLVIIGSIILYCIIPLNEYMKLLMVSGYNLLVMLLVIWLLLKKGPKLYMRLAN